jgi:hypothetical protein
MLKTVKASSNKKTGPIAVTYRAGGLDKFGTCPKTCGLNPCKDKSADSLDLDYLDALLKAVPRRGVSWTYSHFAADMLPLPKAGRTVINASCDTIEDALQAVALKRPAVVAVPVDVPWAKVREGVRFVQCPAELSESFTCAQCGNGSPLCARGDRDYVIVFTAHGPQKKKVGTGDGGCYGASGPVAIQWKNTMKAAGNDGAELLAFAQSLPPGSMIRHHVVGDIGRAA